MQIPFIRGSVWVMNTQLRIPINNLGINSTWDRNSVSVKCMRRWSTLDIVKELPRFNESVNSSWCHFCQVSNKEQSWEKFMQQPYPKLVNWLLFFSLTQPSMNHSNVTAEGPCPPQTTTTGTWTSRLWPPYAAKCVPWLAPSCFSGSLELSLCWLMETS